jgi:hypothetical protein
MNRTRKGISRARQLGLTALDTSIFIYYPEENPAWVDMAG